MPTTQTAEEKLDAMFDSRSKTALEEFKTAIAELEAAQKVFDLTVERWKEAKRKVIEIESEKRTAVRILPKLQAREDAKEKRRAALSQRSR